jgi:DNA-binding HxlR family transcriptional regulator
MTTQHDEYSPLAEALASVGDRWTLLVVGRCWRARGGSTTC